MFSTVVKTPKGTAQGQAGYDNPRENIDPHVRTSAITTKHITLPKKGKATALNFGVPSYQVEFQAEGWDIPGATGFDTTTKLSNIQPVGGTTKGNLGILFNDELKFLIVEDSLISVPALAGGETFTFGASVAGSGDGTDIVFLGGGSVGGNGDGGDITLSGGVPHGTGTTGNVIIETASQDYWVKSTYDEYIEDKRVLTDSGGQAVFVLAEANPTSNNANSYTAISHAAELRTNFNLTDTIFGGLKGAAYFCFNYGTGTVSREVAVAVAMGAVTNGGNVTTADAYFLEANVGAASTITDLNFLRCDNTFGAGTVTNSYFAKIGTDFITNNGVNVDTGTDQYLILSDNSNGIEICDLVYSRKTANSMTVTTGTLASGTVTDTQTWADGNAVNVAEVTGVPGFDVRFTFTNITDFCRVGISAYYTGAIASHYCEVQIYDVTNTTWRTLWTFTGSNGQNYRFSDIPTDTISDYIDGSDQVLIRFYHPTSGNASHDLYIDYVSIIGK